MRASTVVDEVGGSGGYSDPWEVLTDLAILIVEGRTPGGDRGFHAGPHCPVPHQAGGNRHVCDMGAQMCVRLESLLRHLRLMWGVGVGVTVEVLVAPNCEHGCHQGPNTLLDASAAPSPHRKLIEQWNFTILDRKLPEATSTGWSLIAAVRSFLHFSQLSAWLSKSQGQKPPNIKYRLNVTSDVFCSKFIDEEPEEHVFPVALMGQKTSIKVMVRTLPRSNVMPTVLCLEHQSDGGAVLVSSLVAPSLSPTNYSTNNLADSDQEMASSDESSSNQSNGVKNDKSCSELDLRRSLMRSRLFEPSQAATPALSESSRSESPSSDSQLGESLLDPPNSLHRIPRRFQSPSRAGSPSMETPEHIICRTRDSGPSHGRPPDKLLDFHDNSFQFSSNQTKSVCATSGNFEPVVVPARQPVIRQFLTPFSWTQSRYPMHTSYHSTSNAAAPSLHTSRGYPAPFPVFQPYANFEGAQIRHSPLRDPRDYEHCACSDESSGYQSVENSPHPQIGQNLFQNQPVHSSAEAGKYGLPHLKYPHTLYEKQLHTSSEPIAAFQSDHRVIKDGENQEEASGQRERLLLEEHNSHTRYRTLTTMGNSPLNSPVQSTNWGSVDSVNDSSLRVSAQHESSESESGVCESHILDESLLKNCISDCILNRCLNDGCTMDRCVRDKKALVSESSTLVTGQQNVISNKLRENQGIKRKASHNRENSSNKRESPPHEFYSNERDLEKLDWEKKNVGSLQTVLETEGVGWPVDRKPLLAKIRGQVSSTLTDSELWALCSQHRKNLCSNVDNSAGMEDLNSSKGFFDESMSVRSKRSVCPSLDVSSNRNNFDLTPKETEEILNVLRRTTPVPPLRMDQHRSVSEGGREAQNSSLMHLEIGSKFSKLNAAAVAAADQLSKSPRWMWETNDVWCHNAEVTHSQDSNTLRDSSAKPSLEALASSNTLCDTNFKDTSDNNIQSELTLSDGESIEDGLVPEEIENMRLKDEAVAVSAKTVIQKPKTFTATSQLKAIENAKQSTEIVGRNFNRGRNQMNLVLSSIRKVSLDGYPEEKEGEPARTRRTLSFDGNRDGCNELNRGRISRRATSTCDASPTLKSSSSSFVPTSRRTSRASPDVMGVKEELLNCANMRKTLMKRSFQPYITSDNVEEVRKQRLFQDKFKVDTAELDEDDVIKDKVEKECSDGEEISSPCRNGEESRSISSLEELPELIQNGNCDYVDNEKVEAFCDRKFVNNKLDEVVDSHTMDVEYTDGSLDSEFEDEELSGIYQQRNTTASVTIPTSNEKVEFRRSLDSAAHLVFHNKTGLPLTSSPAPLRKGKRFDFDSTLNCISALKSAFRTSKTSVDDTDSEDGLCSPLIDNSAIPNPKFPLSASAPATVACSNLLGSFEECVLNGRLEPVSTVHGFTCEIAASGAFCPKHTTKPVTVFFYTLCDNDQISSPYMGHINLGKKGYQIPCQGTVQVTLFNPHGTVVKMFVVIYDLSDMPPNSRTFLRQRTLNMPVKASDSDNDASQWLRYLIHLRFASSKSGKIYLHTDIRMLIFRKSDADAATLHKTNTPYELRSFTDGPRNPKFSPRK